MHDLYNNPDPATLFSISGDWTEIAPGIRVRLKDAPNEEDMEYPVVLQVDRKEAPHVPVPEAQDENGEDEWWQTGAGHPEIQAGWGQGP